MLRNKAVRYNFVSLSIFFSNIYSCQICYFLLMFLPQYLIPVNHFNFKAKAKECSRTFVRSLKRHAAMYIADDSFGQFKVSIFHPFKSLILWMVVVVQQYWVGISACYEWFTCMMHVNKVIFAKAFFPQKKLHYIK